MRVFLQLASLCNLVVLSAVQLSAQTVDGTGLVITGKAIIGADTPSPALLSDVLRIVGTGTVSGGAATMRPMVIDNDGDVLRDTNTSLSTGGVWTFGADHLRVGADTGTGLIRVNGATNSIKGLIFLDAGSYQGQFVQANSHQFLDGPGDFNIRIFDGSATRSTLTSTGLHTVMGGSAVSNTAPFLRLIETGAGTDETVTELLADADTISLDFVADALGTRNSLFKSQRTGLVPGDWRWGALLGNVRPENNGSTSLGSLNKKYLTLHAWELWVQTLVAQETIATIGGRIFVAPTTTLTRDVASGDTVIYTEHNQMRNNDTVLLQVNGAFEKMLVTSSYTDCSVSGNCSSTGSDYRYTVTRNRDGTGPNDWAAGSAVMNEGNTGDGYIDLYSDRSASSEGYPGQVISAGPVAYWRMDDTTATTTAEVMGNVGVATEAGTPSNGLGRTGSGIGTNVTDESWENTGAAGYLTVAHDTDLQITGDLTIEFTAWWERTAVEGETVLSRSHLGEYEIQVLSDGTLRFSHGNGSASTSYDTAAGVVPITGWHHYAIVRDAASSPKRILFYKNGVLIHSTTYTQAVATSTNTLTIGQNTALTSNEWDGYLDEVAIYNYQVSPDRLLAHSNARGNDSISKFTVGPTICGNVRTGTAAFDVAERWCLGNLRGTYDYGSSSFTATDVYGFAAGNLSAGWLSVDTLNGVRGMFGSTQKFGISTSGVAMFVEGFVTIDNLGIRITNTTSTSDEARAYSFVGNVAFTKRPGLFYLETGGLAQVILSAGNRTGGNDIVTIEGDLIQIAALDGVQDIDVTAGDDLTLSSTGDTTLLVSGNLNINGVNALTTTVVVPCGTLTFTRGILTNKGTC